MNTRTTLSTACLLTAALLARSEAAPPNRHPLPLHDGFYPNANVPCGEAYSAAMIRIMADRFEAGRERCTIKSLSGHGTSFIETDECQDTGMGSKRAGKLTIIIPDDHTVVFGSKNQATRYRYCPNPSLPASFNDAREMVPDTPLYAADR